MCGCLLHTPYWGPGPQPRHVPWPGTELVTLWFKGLHSIHWELHQPGLAQSFWMQQSPSTCLTQWWLLPHWLVQWSHHYSCMHIPVHSPWLLGSCYINSGWTFSGQAPYTGYNSLIRYIISKIFSQYVGCLFIFLIVSKRLYTVVPPLFVEKIILSSLNCLGTLVKNQLTINVRVYFWAFTFIPLFYMCTLIIVP